GELGDLRARAFLTVVSSRIETFANVALEAMAHGSPLVATEVGGIPEVARKDKDALLVPCEAEALAAAIGALLDDPARAAALGASGRSRALSEYAPARVAEMTLAAYRGLLARRRSNAPMQSKAG
ncbi:MAG: glycosyltransferase, partial [Amphiplicatus sp.]|nr:glycosyltransferase [Amphiplicatus sp.]